MGRIYVACEINMDLWVPEIEPQWTEQWLHKDVHILSPSTHKYVNFCGKRDYEDVTNLKILR